jgi:mycothiol synthase
MKKESHRERIIARPLSGDEDYWGVRDLLIKTYPITQPGFNWEVRRWDGWRFYKKDPAFDPHWEKVVCLWEKEGGELVAAIHPEGTGDAHLQVHPDYRYLEKEMIRWAEKHLAAPTEDGRSRQLHILAYEYDSRRRRLLKRMDYKRLERGEVFRRMPLENRPLPGPATVADYTIRTTRPGDNDDCRRIADILNAAFNRDFHTADEHRVFAAHAPCFRHDLDLVAVAPDGSFAAYVGVPYNESNRYGVFEPVCTHPDHRGRGLARMLMIEGLKRLKALGAREVYVGTGIHMTANRLYEAIGLTEASRAYQWRKIF